MGQKKIIEWFKEEKNMETIKNENVQIVGTVSKILKMDEGKNFAIVVLKSEEIPEFARHTIYKNTFVAVGSFMRAVINQELQLTGKWTKHPQYGWRFSVNEAKELLPEATSNEALVKYLSSGLFKGIGEKTAKLITERFGSKTLDVIKYSPELLTEIKGISKSKAETISKSYRQYEYLDDLMFMLKPYNVSNKKVIKIYKRYQDKAIELLKENPYRLCKDIDGFGFKTADQIARACNIDFKHIERIKAGIIHVLTEAAKNDGHLFVTRRSLLIRIKKILNTNEGEITKEDIIPILEQMQENEELVIEDTDIYLPIYYECEKYCGFKLSQMIHSIPAKYKLDIDSIISDLEKKNNITYAPKQKDAMRLSGTTNIAVITGGPGTGKTTIIKGIIEVYKRNFPHGRIVLAAPTGRAAKRMEESTGIEAKTIHRILEYKYSTDGDRIVCNRNENNPIEADLLIIDEGSMIDMLLMTKLLKAIDLKTKVIFVGDADQLPSVGAGNVFRDLIDSKKVPVVMLNEIFRQANTSKIVINADLINKGQHKLEYSDDFIFIEEDDNERLPEIIKQQVMKEYARCKDINKIQVLSPFRTRTSTGVDNLNQLLQDVINPKKSALEIFFGKKTFRVNDKVMQYRNDYNKEVYNGDVGIIKSIDRQDNEYLATINISDKDIDYIREDFEDLDLAYATTIHKSQGCEYDIVIIPVTTQHYLFLQRNMFYTGVTRAKKKVILIGQKKALAMAVKNNKVETRNSKLKERI